MKNLYRKIGFHFLRKSSERICLKTGKKAEYSGVYECLDEMIPLSKGETAPPTPSQATAYWSLVVTL